MNDLITTTTPALRLSGPDDPNFRRQLDLIEDRAGVATYRLRLTATGEPATPAALTVRWELPCTNVLGCWTPGSLYEKRLRADWEEPDLESRISVHAPVISLYGHGDENRLTFACSDTVNTLRLRAPVREEDRSIHCSVELFHEPPDPLREYQLELRLDYSDRRYDRALAGVARWWESRLAGGAAPVPAAAADPVYSTWYAYHQEIDPAELLAECRLAYPLGYRTLIVDDGWQTLDNQRGYAYTGDWEADRFTEMRAFSDAAHELGMRVMIWYSVPFCGPKSRAHTRFRGKFLTEDHRWAPVLDPRYPEVRDYLVGKYAAAVRDWNLDGLKLDFIDDFRTYPATPPGRADGRDFADVNRAVRQLIHDIRAGLDAVRPGLLIEFRQKYVGPELRHLGNLLRAFDCPLDSATNRVRTTDVRLLASTARVHSDMFVWHPGETDTTAALQLTNILFSVPQLSVRLGEQSAARRRMIGFWTGYYNDHRPTLLDGAFTAHRPHQNYPLLHAAPGAGADGRHIFGLYGGAVVTVPVAAPAVDVINGRTDERVVVELPADRPAATVTTYDCYGTPRAERRDLAAGLHAFPVPPAGLLRLEFGPAS